MNILGRYKLPDTSWLTSEYRGPANTFIYYLLLSYLFVYHKLPRLTCILSLLPIFFFLDLKMNMLGMYKLTDTSSLTSKYRDPANTFKYYLLLSYLSVYHYILLRLIVHTILKLHLDVVQAGLDHHTLLGKGARVPPVPCATGPGARFSKVPISFRKVPISRQKVSNITITELFYSRILNINKGFLHTRRSSCIHFSALRHRRAKNGFTGPKSFRGFRETGP